MSRVEELLRRKRQAQIKQLEGGAPDADSHEVDQELANVRAPEVQRAYVKRGRLHMRRHARLRMAQRGMSTRVVYAIWQAGEVHSSDLARTFTDLRTQLARLLGTDAKGSLESIVDELAQLPTPTQARAKKRDPSEHRFPPGVIGAACLICGARGYAQTSKPCIDRANLR